MVHITHQNPKSYRVTHPDWYNGLFVSVEDAMAKEEEYKYYATMERECMEIVAWFAPIGAISMGLLNPIKDYLINVKRNAYNNQYQEVYDHAALAACKNMENLEAQSKALIGKIQGAYDEAVNKAKEMVQPVSDYINNTIKPALENAKKMADDAAAAAANAKQAADNITNYVNTTVTSAVNSANSAANEAKTKAGNALYVIQGDVLPSINKAKTDIAQAQADVKTVTDKINEVIEKANKITSTVNTHTSQISELYQKIKATPSQTDQPNPNPQPSLKELLGLDKIFS